MDLIERQAAIDALKKISFSHWFECGEYLSEDIMEIKIISSNKALEVIEALPSAQPTEASCWGCNCQKMERLKEQKTFSEMVHLHDAETHEERTETHACDCISRQAAIEALKEAFNPSITNFVKAKMAIDNLPSAQPDLSGYSDKLWKAAYERGKAEAHDEIVCCEDCKNRGDDDCPMRFIEWVEYDDDGYIEHDDIIHDYTKDDGFCDRAERRTDGV